MHSDHALDISKDVAAIGAQTGFVELDGLTTHYIEAGQGPLLVLVHGGGAGADSWGNWQSCMADYAKNFRVIAPDMPGFGRTAKPDPSNYDYSQEARNRHLTALIRHFHQGAPAHVIGNSMGGATALGVAMNTPELIRKLVLMGSAGLGISNPDPQAMRPFADYDHSIGAMRKIMEHLGGPRFQFDEKLLEYRHGLMQEPSAQVAIDAIKRSKLTYTREQISSVKTPTLVVGGKADKVAVLARTYGYLDLLENSWGFILPHVGHWAMMESPREFVAVTTAFFDERLF